MEDLPPQEQKPNYIHIYPFRFVQPYPHTYRTFTKGRWVGKGLLATLVKEFKAYPPQYYENAIKTGMITVNNQPTDPEYILKNGDQIIHTSIRVEPPVLDLPIDIISESEEFLIISKPPSIIVHTGGGHHFNTIESLLKYQYNFKGIHVLHRLDKCTSGLLIFAKQKANVALFHQESEKEIMKKMYFARVNGRVEWQEKTLSAYIECVSHKDGVYRVSGQIKEEAMIQKKQEKEQIKYTSEVKQQVGVVSVRHNEKKEEQIKEVKEEDKAVKGKAKKDKKQQTNSDIKDSKTIFKKIWYDEATDTSLLQCYPVTGRTHQIRVHLQYLGHPILNDTAYGGRFVGNGIINFIEGTHSKEEDTPGKKIKPAQELRVEEWDYIKKPWEIMLHSFQYKFAGKTFQTKLPYWFQRDSIKPSSLPTEA